MLSRCPKPTLHCTILVLPSPNPTSNFPFQPRPPNTKPSPISPLLPNTYPSSLPKYLLCLQATFTRRTSGPWNLPDGKFSFPIPLRVSTAVVNQQYLDRQTDRQTECSGSTAWCGSVNGKRQCELRAVTLLQGNKHCERTH
jgi:hypothetical protein